MNATSAELDMTTNATNATTVCVKMTNATTPATQQAARPSSVQVVMNAMTTATQQPTRPSPVQVAHGHSWYADDNKIMGRPINGPIPYKKCVSILGIIVVDAWYMYSGILGDTKGEA